MAPRMRDPAAEAATLARLHMRQDLMSFGWGSALPCLHPSLHHSPHCESEPRRLIHHSRQSFLAPDSLSYFFHRCRNVPRPRFDLFAPGSHTPRVRWLSMFVPRATAL